jgi:hypothetical protein
MISLVLGTQLTTSFEVKQPSNHHTSASKLRYCLQGLRATAASKADRKYHWQHLYHGRWCASTGTEPPVLETLEY